MDPATLRRFKVLLGLVLVPFLVCCAGPIVLASLLPDAPEAPREAAASQALDMQPFTVDGVAYTVVSTQTRTRVGSWPTKRQALPGTTFVLVEMHVENGNHAPVYLPDLFLVDAQGRRFSPDAEAGAALLVSGAEVPIVEELQPNVPVRLTLAFIVPKDASGLAFQVGASMP